MVQEIKEDQIEEDFVNLLIKMFNLTPLEIVVELAKKGIFPNAINFILEHVDPESNVDVVITSEVTYKGLAPIHLAAYFVPRNLQRNMDHQSFQPLKDALQFTVQLGVAIWTL